MIRSILVTVEIIMLIIFVIPLFSGILNPGNAVGIFVCIVAGVITVYFDRFLHAASALSRSPGGKIFLCTCAAVTGFVIVYVSVLSGLMLVAQNRTDEGAKAVIVLGCKVKGNEPSRMLERRLESAYDYLRFHPDLICVVSGGKGSDEKISEAKAMRDYLVKKGIDQKRIIMEDRSSTTAENMEFSADILREQNIDSAAIVTDGFHQYRASLLAKREGIYASAVNAKNDFMTKWLVPTYWVREWMAITKEYLG